MQHGNKKLYSNLTIKKLVASFMLLLFAISVAPKQLLHDVVTGHKHNYAKPGDGLKVQTPKNNFQCGWRNDAVESPFTHESSIQPCNLLPVYTSYIYCYIRNYQSAEQLFSSLRGPPCLG